MTCCELMRRTLPWRHAESRKCAHRSCGAVSRRGAGRTHFCAPGPGAARDVVTQLLSGSHFNYVILSSASEPQGITRLMLSRGASTRESPTSDAPALPANDPPGDPALWFRFRRRFWCCRRTATRAWSPRPHLLRRTLTDPNSQERTLIECKNCRSSRNSSNSRFSFSSNARSNSKSSRRRIHHRSNSLDFLR